METKVNSSVVGNKVTMKLVPSVVPVGTESVLVLCCVPLHHFISLGTAGSLVDKWTGLHFDWGGCIYMSTLPPTQTLFPSSLSSSQLWTLSQFSWQGRWARCPQCLCAAVRCWVRKAMHKGLKAFLWEKSSPDKINVPGTVLWFWDQVAWHSWCPNGYLLLYFKVSCPHQNWLLGVVFGANCPSALSKYCVGTCLMVQAKTKPQILQLSCISGLRSVLQSCTYLVC